MKIKPVSESDVEEMLKEVLLQGYQSPTGAEVEDVASFYEDGLLTNNHGVVIRLSDGTEFQLTIVRSR